MQKGPGSIPGGFLGQDSQARNPEPLLAIVDNTELDGPRV